MGESARLLQLKQDLPCNIPMQNLLIGRLLSYLFETMQLYYGRFEGANENVQSHWHTHLKGGQTCFPPD